MAGHATLRHRQLGSVLRGHRVDAGLTLEMVARRLTTADAMSAAKISRIENGQYAVNPQDVRALCRVYRLDQTATEELVEHAAQAMRRGWWQDESVSPLPETYKRYIEYEETCGGLAVFAPVFVPDLLQTAAYTRMLIAGLWPQKTTRERTALAAALTRRQYRFTVKTGPRVDAVLDSIAVLRSWGDPTVTQRQAAYLLEVSQHPRITLRVIPDSRIYPGAHTAYTLLSLGPGAGAGSERNQPERHQRVGFVGGVLGGALMERAEELDWYAETFEHQREVALSPEETRRWLRQAVKSLGGIA